MEKQYTIISPRWAQDEVNASLKEIKEQADIYRRDDSNVSLIIDTMKGVEVIVDNTGDIVAVETSGYDKYFGID
jgi:hypothetical protein